ncbi:hypothetical protein DE146DRAFT_30940 [Phaeosphaeria sp. MPI-PUGE-AT-0046c]|nr:hypothetical protein DE146DRAFT_30940 [Phaeosphaeria sp. MPI-PUGE-AT-0046c]
MSTINMVKFFFMRGSVPKDAVDVQSLMTLAYQTAREQNIYPKQILIRGLGHSTTTIAGRYQPDPDGNHFTFCYKDENHVQSRTHIACHGYTPGPKNYQLSKATFVPAKPDSTPKSRNNKPVWPAEKDLVVVPPIGYNHQ